MQRGRAVRERDRVTGAEVVRERALEPLDRGPLGESVGPQHLDDGRRCRRRRSPGGRTGGSRVTTSPLHADGQLAAARRPTATGRWCRSRSTKPSSSGLPSARPRRSGHHGVLGQDDVDVAGVERVPRLVRGDQQLVQLLAGPDADDLAARHAGRDRLGEVDDAHRRDLRDEDLAALHAARGASSTRSTACVERDPEAGHALVGDRERARSRACSRNTGRRCRGCRRRCRSARTRSAVWRVAGVGVALHEDLLGAELGRAVEVDRVDGLVGRERDDRGDAVRRSRRRRRAGRRGRWSAPPRTGCTRRPAPASSPRRARRCRRPRRRASSAVAVAHVADEVAEPGSSPKRAAHLRLLQLVAAEDADRPSGRARAAAISTKALPNEPVPPVTSTVFPSKVTTAAV